MLTIEARLVKVPDGKTYGKGSMNYNFFCRYLEVFDEVLVLARVGDASNLDSSELHRADGPNVSVVPVPCYLGPWQYLRRYFQIIKKAIKEADAYILRAPGQTGSLLYNCLKKHRIPYGVEVIGDPWQYFSRFSRKGIDGLPSNW
jgi:hypothetical protein